MNLGSPDSTEVKDVRKYLNEFLMDERVIDSPYLLRLPLVKGIITPFRAPKSAAAYRSIWTKEGSPLIVLTRQLQEALQQQVEEPVYMAMRYGNPSPKEAYDRIVREHPGIEEVVLLPLYPHYAMSSYETAMVYAQKLHQKGRYPFRLSVVQPYYKEERYIDALSESIRPYLQEEYDHIVFSYHGLPERHILKGGIREEHDLRSDTCCSEATETHKTCYRHQCLATMRLVAQKLGIPKEKYSYSFQSRLGRDEWLKPYTVVRLEEMPGEGIRKLLVVCPAFVSDCLETLEEMGGEGKVVFLHAGGESFTLIPCMNVQPQWVEAIASWIGDYRKGSSALIS